MTRSTRAPLMRSQLVVATLAHVRAENAGADKLIERFGLPQDIEQRSEAVLPLDALREFFEAAAHNLNDPLLGVHMARTVDRGAFGLLAFSSRAAPTVREALARLARYIRLSNDTVEVNFDEDKREGVISQRVPGHPACLGRHANEFFVALLLDEGRRMLGQELRPTKVWLAHPAPRGIALAEELGVERITFSAERNALSFARSVLDLACPRADASLLSYLDQQAQKELSTLSVQGFVPDVRRAVREQLPRGTVTLARVAKLLGMSRRTLQRRLEEEETSFQRLLDSAREELAKNLVAEGNLPLARVALAVGYSDERPFLRAFKRWTGVTPGAYREQRQ